MRHPALAVSLALSLLAPSLAPAAAPDGARAEHVVLVSIDGLRPEFYRDADWPTPTLQWLARQGASADAVRGVYPTVTYPSHTSMITGALPARHGIFYNSPFEPGGQTGRWYWEASAIQVPTLWDAVHEAGGTTASLAWPVSVGAPVDYNIPEVWSLKRGFGTVAPIRAAEHPAGLLAELEREATGRLAEDDMSIDHLTRETITASMASYLIEMYRPTFMTVHLIGVDHFEHADGRDSRRVRQALASADNAVREIMDALDRAGIAEHTALIVTGDHGFIDIHSALAPNVWLRRAGLLEDAPDRGDWRAAFHTSAASAFLILRDPDDQATVERVREILAALPSRERKLFRILDRDELSLRGAAPDAVLALAPVPGVSMTASAAEPVLHRAHGATHGFLPELPQLKTGFIGYGAGLQPGAVAPEIGLEDIAPIVAALLGLRFEAPDGVLYPGFLTRQ